MSTSCPPLVVFFPTNKLSLFSGFLSASYGKCPIPIGDVASQRSLLIHSLSPKRHLCRLVKCDLGCVKGRRQAACSFYPTVDEKGEKKVDVHTEPLLTRVFGSHSLPRSLSLSLSLSLHHPPPLDFLPLLTIITPTLVSPLTISHTSYGTQRSQNTDALPVLFFFLPVASGHETLCKDCVRLGTFESPSADLVQEA